MKVLIIDDSDSKADQIAKLLRSTINGIQIERAKSFRSGTKALEQNCFDLLVLDMVLPIRDFESPVDQGGRNVLAEILEGTCCRRPSHIVCLTAFNDVACSFRGEAERRLVHVVIYSETSNNWRESLAEKAQQIERRICEAKNYPKEYKADLAIITSSPNVELNEVLKLPGFSGEYNQDDLLHYYLSNWDKSDTKRLTVVACAAPTMGMTASCVTACKVIDRWRPRYLSMTGIAAGTKKDEHFGDILIAESVYDYGSGKIAESSDGSRIFIPSHNQIRMDPGLRALLQRWERDQLRTDEIRRSWHVPIQSSPLITIGVLATGSAVVQSQELVDEILSNSRKVVGLDMEAYGVFHAAHLAPSPQPKVLVAKSVSDFADKRKDDSWQQYAAFTSARFIYEFFTNEPGLQF